MTANEITVRPHDEAFFFTARTLPKVTLSVLMKDLEAKEITQTYDPERDLIVFRRTA